MLDDAALGSGSDAAAKAVDAGQPSDAEADRGSPFALCARDAGQDVVRDVFCNDPPPIGDLRALQDALGIVADEDGLRAPVVLLGHSTALSGHKVSPINPRGLIVRDQLVMALQRGIQQVEIAAPRRGEYDFNFYLLRFKQACNTDDGGCVPGDLYTPALEHDWLSIELHDDEDLKNTAADCRQCHRRSGERAVLLMRELNGPWMHFFLPLQGGEVETPQVNGVDLARDYFRAKGEESLAGLPAEVLRGSNPFLLELSVTVEQPLLFDSITILDEVWPYGEDGWSETPQRRPTGERNYAAFKRGEHLAWPYYRQRATDPEKQQALTEAYQRYRTGELDADDLPDLSDIYPDDPKVRAEIGLQVEPGATPAQALVQACAPCHNDVLDQSLSRARFSIDLSRMGQAELVTAVQRLLLDVEDPGRMPPPEARQLDDDARAALVEYLRSPSPTEEDAQLLQRAAQLGMAGPAVP